MWTFIRGEMYVSCVDGCVPLPLEGLVPPLSDGEDPDGHYEGGALDGTSEETGGVPCEGGDASMNGKKDHELPF